jgi:amidophosphoribosyltransferase
MCGIIGIVGTTEVASALYDGLTVLQHRGQDAAGIATVEGSRLRLHKGNGLVRDVFGQRAMGELRGRIGIGHCRYPTAGSEGSAEAQPLYVNSPYGIAFAHNGNLVNTDALRREMFEGDRRHINTDSDSEVLLNVLAHELQIQDRMELTPDHIFKAVAGVHARARGGYACIALLLGYGLVAFRDPHGIRPLVLGERVTAEGHEYAVASESVALDVLGFKRLRDVMPGEAVIITDQGQLHSRRCAEGALHTPCIFEYVYLARPDSMIEDVSVYKARLRMGEKLAAKILRERGIGLKFNPLPEVLAGKRVVVVDDSIVRGTTTRPIVDLHRRAGATEVHDRNHSPAMAHPCYLGVDTARREELIAHRMTVEEIAEHIGADSLGYLSLPGLFRAVNLAGDRLCSGCFTGNYPVPMQLEFSVDGKLTLEEAAARQSAYEQSRMEFDVEQDELDRDRVPIGADH